MAAAAAAAASAVPPFSAASTAAVVAKPSRNTVFTLDDSVVNATINTTAGLVITATPEVEEI